jgi:hypothetical protein
MRGLSALPSGAGMVARIQTDPSFPDNERTRAVWAIGSACRWAGLAAAAVPFTAASARALLAGMSPAKAKVSKKTIQNARSAIESVLRFYGLERSSMRSIPLAIEFDRWFARLSCYEKASAGGFFRFLSMRGCQINEVCDADADAYLALLEAEFPVAHALRRPSRV